MISKEDIRTAGASSLFDIKSQRYITLASKGSTLMVRVPGCKQRNFHKSKPRDALECRDILCRSVGIDPYSWTDFRAGRRLTQPHSDKASELPPGICLSKYKKILADGSEEIYQRVVAQGLPGAKKKTRSFNVSRYGLDQAIVLAIAWREQSQLIK